MFFKLLGRSGSGQRLTSYTSFLSGPRREGEINGPEKFYLLLLDNGRTRVLADAEKRETLYCIRCGACSNVCPVFRRIGGHSYPGTYSGPIGAILTPQFQGVTYEPDLPFASSLCGACGEVCPVKIDIPKMLLALRRDVKRADSRERESRLEKRGFQAWSWVMRHPRVFETLGVHCAGGDSAAGSWALVELVSRVEGMDRDAGFSASGAAQFSAALARAERARGHRSEQRDRAAGVSRRAEAAP